jgi:hypothetical protein
MPAFTGVNLLDMDESPEVGRQVLISAVLHAFRLEDLSEEDDVLVFHLFAGVEE